MWLPVLPCVIASCHQGSGSSSGVHASPACSIRCCLSWLFQAHSLLPGLLCIQCFPGFLYPGSRQERLNWGQSLRTSGPVVTSDGWGINAGVITITLTLTSELSSLQDVSVPHREGPSSHLPTSTFFSVAGNRFRFASVRKGKTPTPSSLVFFVLGLKALVGILKITLPDVFSGVGRWDVVQWVPHFCLIPFLSSVHLEPPDCLLINLSPFLVTASLAIFKRPLHYQIYRVSQKSASELE